MLWTKQYYNKGIKVLRSKDSFIDLFFTDYQPIVSFKAGTYYYYYNFFRVNVDVFLGITVLIFFPDTSLAI